MKFFLYFVARIKINVKLNFTIMKKYLHLALLLFVFAGFAKAQGAMLTVTKPMEI